MNRPSAVVERLRAALGERVDLSADARGAARADKSGHAASGTPLAVVNARTIEDVQITLRIASETGT
ncbi:MAG: FAD-binding oxidoreductase, partial [Microbacterium sp.]